jgi:modulator of FtsH protease
MGKWLFVGALAIMIGAIVNVFVGSSVGMLVISVMAIGIFSAYMLYDLKRIIDGGETNYISATLALYLDIFTVFQSLLALLGIPVANATDARGLDVKGSQGLFFLTPIKASPPIA